MPNDLIYRDALIAELSERQRWQDEKQTCVFKEGFDCGLEAAIEDATNVPTVDAVPVVRCGQCRFAKDPYTSTSKDKCCYCSHDKFEYGKRMADVFMPVKHCSDFCSYGERKGA